jgi:hypothetical protein
VDRVSQRHTTILPRREAGTKVFGLSVYGRKTRADMLAYWRRHYQRQLEEAQAALALTDDQLIVKTYVGAFAQKNVQEVTE